MSHIDLKDCLSKIDDKKIDKYNYANVYVSRNENAMAVKVEYSNKLHNAVTIVEFDRNDTELTEELWQELIALSDFISEKYEIERILDDVFSDEDDEPYKTAPIAVIYQIDSVLRRRLRRLTEAYNSMGFNYSIEDTMQAVMVENSTPDIEKRLTFFENLLLSGDKSKEETEGENSEN